MELVNAAGVLWSDTLLLTPPSKLQVQTKLILSTLLTIIEAPSVYIGLLTLEFKANKAKVTSALQLDLMYRHYAKCFTLVQINIFCHDYQLAVTTGCVCRFVSVPRPQRAAS